MGKFGIFSQEDSGWNHRFTSHYCVMLSFLALRITLRFQDDSKSKMYRKWQCIYVIGTLRMLVTIMDIALISIGLWVYGPGVIFMVCMK